MTLRSLLHFRNSPTKFVVSILISLAPVAHCVELRSSTTNLGVSECLAISRVGRATRSPVHTDAIEAQIVSGKWHAPAFGETVTLPDGSSQTWKKLEAVTNGWFQGLRGGYAYVPVVVESSCVMMLKAAGHDLVYVNGALRAGDPYQYGYVHLPIPLHAGTNDLLFHCSRGRLKIELAKPEKVIALDLDDSTFPDLITGEQMDTWGAVLVVNAAAETVTGLSIRASVFGQRPATAPVPDIAPFSVRKVGFRLRARLPKSGEKAALHLTLLRQGGHPLDAADASLRIRRPDQTQKRTFVSDIDGSVQYWALNPAGSVGHGKPPPALFLSLHGASVEAIGQSDAYSPKRWGHLAAPTNRRPYGFDWEDWGRLDALEVLNIAKATLHPDPQRIYLTGHSMGGHGTWQLGALFPDRFAAIGPSAGWISFFSYAGGARYTNGTPVEAMLQRASATSDTLSLETNYLQEGVYILHGGDDDNVPVREARKMNEELSRFHHDFQYHEQPGVGHWWDKSDEPGADCVDWPPMFDFLAHHVIPTDESLRQVNFTTPNPGVSAKCHWLEIEQQIHPLQPSTVDVHWDPGKRRFVGTTENVARLAFRLRQIKPGDPLKAELDGQTIENIPWPNSPELWLHNDSGKWNLAVEPSPALKGPERYGPFKDAFRHRMIFVYGTRGTAEENAWAFNKARFDAESFWYRGNGSVDVVPDTALNPKAESDRSVILYGNADSNGAWAALLGDSPVQVHRGEVKVGDRVSASADLACLFLRPRPGSNVACVGVVSGSGLTGMKLTDRLNYFLSGVGFPDCTVIGPEMLSEGVKGVRVAGFFGNDWSVAKGEFAWRDN
jgi:dienelactone hydrolase